MTTHTFGFPHLCGGRRTDRTREQTDRTRKQDEGRTDRTQDRTKDRTEDTGQENRQRKGLNNDSESWRDSL